MARTTPLTAESLSEFPDDCRQCTFWELGGPRPRELPSRADEEVRKQAWVTTQVLESGAPGRVVHVDGALAGWAVFAPATAFPSRVLETVPGPAAQALFLATIRVARDHRSSGVGRLLVQAAVKEAVQRELRWVEVVGDHRWEERSCMLPVSWLLDEGFEIRTDHPRHPVLRLSTSTTVRWSEAIGHAVDGVRGLLPRRTPARRTAPDAFQRRGPT